MRVISLVLADKEVARVEEGVFKNSSTFDERFELVKEQNYFCFSKPKLQLAARIL